jgi:hypothetical protein
MRTFPRVEGKGGGVLLALFVSFVVILAGQDPAIALAAPKLSSQASSAQALAGDQVFDTATLAFGSNPTGSITFRLFGPNNVSCTGNPVFSTMTAVTGNGYYQSGRTAVGTVGTYRWTAVYGGDANNAPSPVTACADPASQMVVGKRVPVLNAVPSLGLGFGDSATLSAGAVPTGTLTFKLFGPDDGTCVRAPFLALTRTVAGNGTYTTGPIPPVPPGIFRWVVGYSGDANNVARTTSCSDTNAFTFSTTKVSATPTPVVRGGTLTVAWSGIAAPTRGDWVGLYRVGAPDGGLVATWKYTTGTATGSMALKFPWTTIGGQYEVRLMADNSSRRLATSAPITLVW